MDPAVLRRCAADLNRVAEGLSAASSSIAGAKISSNAFGMMNSWMVDPITTVSAKSKTLIEDSGKVSAAIGKAADGSAGDFDRAEEMVISTITDIQKELDAQ